MSDEQFDWNGWRAEYDVSSFDHQKKVYEDLAQLFPEQAHFSFEAALKAVEGASSVTEVGGWRGDLAAQILAQNDGITSWKNYDLCHWALNDGNRCEDTRYTPVELADWPWNVDLQPADVFVSTHCIEHMRWNQLKALSEQFRKFKKVHLEAPLLWEESKDWSNYVGTHILEVSWSFVNDHILSLGFICDGEPSDCRTYVRV